MTDSNSLLSRNQLLLCRGSVLDLSTPVVMGILNTTPDSFSDGGLFDDQQSALDRISEMAEQGVTIIDIGGESTRPGSDPVSVDEELSRTIPVLERAIDKYPELFFSIDTTKYEVAKKALQAGAHILNDVSGLRREPRFADLCRKTGAAYICMHSKGDPKTMQNNPSYKNVVEEVLSDLKRIQIELAQKGVDNIIIDPGIGFGKTVDHNLQLVHDLKQFLRLKSPILIGASRKSLLGKILNNRPVGGRLAGTVALHYHCLMQGASILRVHDVQEASDSVRIFNAIQSVSTDTT